MLSVLSYAVVLAISVARGQYQRFRNSIVIVVAALEQDQLDSSVHNCTTSCLS